MNISFVIRKAVKYFIDVYCVVKKLEYVQPDIHYVLKKILSFRFPVLHACGCLPEFVEMVWGRRVPYME